MLDEWDDIPEDIKPAIYKMATEPVGDMSYKDIVDLFETMYQYLNDAHSCQAEIFHGDPNPDSPNFGPTEYCESIALVDAIYCDIHIGSSGREEPDEIFEEQDYAE